MQSETQADRDRQTDGETEELFSRPFSDTHRNDKTQQLFKHPGILFVFENVHLHPQPRPHANEFFNLKEQTEKCFPMRTLRKGVGRNVE